MFEQITEGTLKLRKCIVLREVELASMTELKKGDVFRLERASDKDDKVNPEQWNVAEGNGFDVGGVPGVQCHAVAIVPCFADQVSFKRV